MDDLKKLKRIAMQLLARRDHSRQELIRKLEKHHESLELRQSIVDDLIKQGLQSDERFAENYLHYRAMRGFGPVRIKLELMERGVSQNIVEMQFAAFDDNWLSLAKKVYTKRFGSNLPKDYLKRAQHTRFLQYRGFPTDIIHQLFHEF